MVHQLASAVTLRFLPPHFFSKLVWPSPFQHQRPREAAVTSPGRQGFPLNAPAPPIAPSQVMASDADLIVSPTTETTQSPYVI